MKKSRAFLSLAALILCGAAVWAGKTNQRFMVPGPLYYSGGDNQYFPFDPGRRASVFTLCTKGQEQAKTCYEDICYGVYTYEKGEGYLPVCEGQ